MGSAFDSEVYSERQRLPGVTINAARLMTHLLWTVEGDGEIDLRVERRGDVDTGQWWTLRWGNSLTSASTLELCLFRAAVLARRTDERSRKYAGIGPTPIQGPQVPPGHGETGVDGDDAPP